MRLRAMYDVVVVGGGVVGCAVARRFVLEGAKVALLEKGADILSGASKGNSAILHTGFDAPTGSLELACMQAGYAEYMDIRARLRLPVLETGAVVAAWNEEELAKLPGIVQTAHANGVTDVRQIAPDEVLAREPRLSPHVLGGVLVPHEHVIDPWSAPLAYALQALVNGGEVRRNTVVLSGHFANGMWRLETNTGTVECTTVINCAGLYGDILDQRLTGEENFAIKPRKGQFVVFDKAAARHLRTILLPVPTERTKGIVITPTAFGNLLVGPTAEEQDSRDHAAVDEETLRMLVDKAVELVPSLEGMGVTAVYAGVRPATERKEYRVRHETARNYIVLGGIRSTGLTAALGLARHAWKLYARMHERLTNPIWPQAPRLAEHCPRDWQTPGYGEIVCHCEMVTQREIEVTLTGPLPAQDYNGLKRRTRAGMGRCQGFYCNARVAEMTAGRFANPLAVGGTHG
ncbi:NAD(P)/FAD-dependent oxidoreductase [Acidocella aromatica]|uniref:Glycerol-3-phosphate dehydrogenase n=1 Tax=Acidocella aromatica TaxID=1303579 RepID=A0A840VEN9_9PROT|nr:NAD(P)/FAD-dependent oxidoreductase [Acidocella aromatica]MBB5374166.1 glycerol-3-phosphate dehydrogenase [Acidocella aromatica]